jgi:tRNA-dihydrouridine synthase
LASLLFHRIPFASYTESIFFIALNFIMDIYFAPLQGFTEDIYRRLHHKLVGGVAQYYSPFVRLEHGGVRSKDARDVRPEFNLDVPFTPQVIAKDVHEFKVLVDYLVALGYRQIDLNMGCPFPLQARHGRGSGLLQNPEQVKDILGCMHSYPEVTFSVKMRLGQESIDEGMKILPLLNDAPLSQITLHPRLGNQQYKGEVDLEGFAHFAEMIKHPLVYNGDLRTPEDIQRIAHDFPNLKGVMIGRGLLARPSLAVEYQEGEAWSAQQRVRLISNIHEHYHEHLADIIPGEGQLLTKLQSFWEYMDEDLLGRKALKKVRKAGNMKNY